MGSRYHRRRCYQARFFRGPCCGTWEWLPVSRLCMMLPGTVTAGLVRLSRLVAPRQCLSLASLAKFCVHGRSYFDGTRSFGASSVLAVARPAAQKLAEKELDFRMLDTTTGYLLNHFYARPLLAWSSTSYDGCRIDHHLEPRDNRGSDVSEDYTVGFRKWS
jgi:hypothetical protein